MGGREQSQGHRRSVQMLLLLLMMSVMLVVLVLVLLILMLSLILIVVVLLVLLRVCHTVVCLSKAWPRTESLRKELHRRLLVIVAYVYTYVYVCWCTRNMYASV